MAKVPAIPNQGTHLRVYDLKAGEVFNSGAAVTLSSGEVAECGADPASILGFAEHASGVDPDPGIVVVATATAASTFWLEGSSDPAEADIGVKYGLAVDGDGDWYLDKTETTNTRVVVEAIDLTRKLFEVRVLEANRALG